MAFSRPHFRSLIERTLAEMALALSDLRLNSPAAVELLEATCAQESHYGTYLRQINRGPGRGIFQIEHREHFDYLRRTYGDRIPILRTATFDQLEWDLKLSIVIARLWYWEAPDPLPPAGDREGQWLYYKRHFNSLMGKATREQFMDNFRRYITME